MLFRLCFACGRRQILGFPGTEIPGTEIRDQLPSGADNEARTEDNYLNSAWDLCLRLRRVGRLPGGLHPRFLARSTQGGASRNFSLIEEEK